MLATALAVCGHHSRRRIATVSVADCDGSADFVRNFYDVSLEIPCDINSAGNSKGLLPSVLAALGRLPSNVCSRGSLMLLVNQSRFSTPRPALRAREGSRRFA